MFLQLPTSGKFTCEFHNVIKSLEMHLFFLLAFFSSSSWSLPSVNVLNDLAFRCVEDDVL